MKITRLNVNGFGVFRDFEAELNAPVCLFYGHNEAGKSTLQQFIRSILFGFPTRANRPERYEPLNGGAHGGWLTLSDEHGRKATVERYDRSAAAAWKEKMSGGAKIVFEDGAIGGESMLQSFLGGLTPEMFRNLFAFGLTELHELRSLQSDEIGSFLFNAGMGAEGQALLHTERKLVQEMDRLFKPKGSKQEMNVVLQGLDKLEHDIRMQKEHVPAYNRSLEQIHGLDDSIDSGTDQLAELRRMFDWYDKCLKARERWIRLTEMQKELNELPSFEGFPEDAAGRFERLLSEKEAIIQQSDSLNVKYEQLNNKLKELSVDDSILAVSPELETVLERARAYQESKKMVTEYEVELQHINADLHKLLRNIGMEWNEETLERFPVSVSHRESIRNFRESLHKSKTALDRLEEELQRRNEQVREAELSVSETQMLLRKQRETARQKLLWVKEMPASELYEVWHGLKRAYSEWKQLQADRIIQVQQYEHVIHNEKIAKQWEEQSRRWEQQLPSKTTAGGEAADREAIVRKGLMFGIGISVLIPSLVGLLTSMMYPALISFAALTAATAILYFTSRSALSHDNKRSGRGRSGRADRDGSAPDSAAVTVMMPSVSLSKEKYALEAQIKHTDEQMIRLSVELHGKLNSICSDDQAAAAVESLEPFYAAAGSRSTPSLSAETLQRSEFDWLDQWMSALEEAIPAWEKQQMQLEASTEKWNEAKKELDSLKQHRSHTERMLSDEIERHDAVAEEWQQWLKQHEMNEFTSPEAALEIVQLAEQGKQTLHQKQLLTEKVRFLKEQCDTFERQCRLLIQSAERTLTGSHVQIADRDDSIHDAVDGTQLLVSLKRLKETVDYRMKIRYEKQSIQANLEQLEHEQKQYEEQLARARQKINMLWQQAGAEHEEQFRHLVKCNDRAMELKKAIRHEEVFMETWVGSHQQSRLYNDLRHKDEAELKRLTQELLQEIQQLEARLNDERDRRGRLRNEIEKLRGDDAHAETLLQYQEQLASFKHHTNRWATLAFCVELFKKTREVYERERQPSVLRRASEYFQIMTEGRYERVLSPLGSNKILVSRGNGQQIESSSLSRGTAEQLYLAMRFALAEEFAVQRNVSIPFIMDDIFVNFDMERLKNSLKLVVQLSERHQMILFTCHSHVKEAVAAAVPEYELIELSL